MIRVITEPAQRQAICRKVLEALPEWFGITESQEQYIAECALQTMVAWLENDLPCGFIALKPTGRATMELAVMGVLPGMHRQGIGRQLFEKARSLAAEAGYSFMQVKTVRMGVYPEYDVTNRFYLSLGFQEFEVFPTLWDEANPCQIYVMNIR